ncbi:hypothetical protein ACH5RR_020442 [Cinchona calisaya]|uniref:Uncharacterized protein n=1 Tax=Cinchona calisaya TaxID=153742 RepID=A0ABD2ZFL5_9GENT
MAFKGNNPFALLNDDDDGDFSPVLPSHNAPESITPAKPQFVRSEREGRGRWNRGPGSGRNSGTDVERVGDGQQNGMQKNQERESNHHQSNGYRLYNGHPQNRGRRANGYQQQNWGDNGYRKNDVQEQNKADVTKPYVRDSSSNGDDGTEKGPRDTVGGGRGRRFDEKNGFTNHDRVPNTNQQIKSKWVIKGPGGSEEKFTGGDSYAGDDNQFTNGRSSSGKVDGGNWDKDDSSFPRQGNGEVETGERKETGGGNKELMDNGEKHASRKGKRTAKVSKDGDSKQNGEEVPTGNNAKAGIEEEKEEFKMTLQQYEKQLLEKRKTLDSLKTEERKVTIDKDLESMQLVGRKREDFGFVKLHSEKEKHNRDDSHLEKDEKLGNVCGAITRALYQGPRRAGGYRGYSTAATTRVGKAPSVEDLNQFPRLGCC